MSDVRSEEHQPPDRVAGIPGVYLHPLSLCESTNVGAGTRIYAFAHVLPGATIGRDCNVNDGVFVESDVSVGDRVTIKCGVQLWDGVRLADDVFVGPNATFTNDKFPRSKQYPDHFLETYVGQGASIGANATILPGITIGRGAMIAAGAVVTRNVPPHSIVAGTPARITGYAHAARSGRDLPRSRNWEETSRRLSVEGARLVELTGAADLRGNLMAAEADREIPFTPKRLFTVYGVASDRVRGEHAHLSCSQFLIAVAGSVSVLLDDGQTRDEILLNDPHRGLLIPPLVWGTQYRYSSDAVLLVAASHRYDPADYIRDYDEFLAIVHRAP